MTRAGWRLGGCCLLLAASWPAVAATNQPAGSPPAPAPAPLVAPPAPAFKLKDLDGREVKRADFAGRPLLVTFWASWDKPSRRQLPVLVALQKRLGPAGLQVIGISLDTVDRVTLRQFAVANGLNFPVLLFDLKVVEDFGGITGIPTTVLIDRNHNIIQHYVGFTDELALSPELAAVMQAK